VTIDPNDVGENLTNEPPFAGHGSDRESAELRTLADGSDDKHFHAEVDIEKASKWIREEVEKRQAIRADELRRLNEESRTEADALAVVRRARRRGMGIEQSESTPHVECKAGGIGPALSHGRATSQHCNLRATGGIIVQIATPSRHVRDAARDSSDPFAYDDERLTAAMPDAARESLSVC
jgi:hypothetical protein